MHTTCIALYCSIACVACITHITYIKQLTSHHRPHRRLAPYPHALFACVQTFEREAAEAGFHVRTGTECNPGACYAYLGEKRGRGGEGGVCYAYLGEGWGGGRSGGARFA